MNANVLLSIVLFCHLQIHAQQWSWSKKSGSFSPATITKPLLVSLSGGDVVVMNANYDPGSFTTQCSRLRRYDFSGNLIYDDSITGQATVPLIIPGSSDELIVLVQPGSSATVIDTTYSNPARNILVAINSNGQRKWNRLLQPSSTIFDMVGKPNGNIVLTGASPAPGSVWQVVEFNSLGNLLVSHNYTYTGKPGEQVRIVHTCSDMQNNLYISGYFSGDLFKLNNVTYYQQAGPYICSFIICLDPSGNIKNVDIIKESYPAAMKADQAGNVVVLLASDASSIKIREDSLVAALSGNWNGTTNFISSLSPAGTCNWITEAQRFGVYDNSPDYTLDVTFGGNIFLTGYSGDTLHYSNVKMPFGKGVFVCKINSQGVLQWSQQAASSNTLCDSYRIAAAPNNAIYVAGAFKNDIAFGGGQLTGNNDQFLAMIVDGQLASGVTTNRENENLYLIPNPTNGVFRLNSKEEMTSAGIFNLQGILIKDITLKDNAIVDLTGFPRGVYFAMFKSAGGVIIKKVILQ